MHEAYRAAAERLKRLQSGIRDGNIVVKDLGSQYALPYNDTSLAMTNFQAADAAGANDAEGSIPFTVSVLAEDRDGDVVIPLGARTKNYARNPVIFFGHQEWEIPIAKSSSRDGQLQFYPSEREIHAKAYFDRDDPDADYIYGKVKRGFLNAASMAFVPIVAIRREVTKAHSDRETGPWIYKEYDVTEWSIVGVPSNAGAIRDSLDREKSFISPRLQKGLGRFAAKSRGLFNGFTVRKCGCKGLDDCETCEEKDLNSTSGAAGGYTVPTDSVVKGPVDIIPYKGKWTIAREGEDKPSISERVNFATPEQAIRFAKDNYMTVVNVRKKRYVAKDGGETDNALEVEKFDTLEEAKKAAMTHGGVVKRVMASVVKTLKGYVKKNGGFTDDIDQAKEFSDEEAMEKADDMGADVELKEEPAEPMVVKTLKGYVRKDGPGFTDDPEKAAEFPPDEAMEKAEELGGEALEKGDIMDDATHEKGFVVKALKGYVAKSGGFTHDIEEAKTFMDEEAAQEKADEMGAEVEEKESSEPTPPDVAKSVVKTVRGYVAKSGGFTDDVDEAKAFTPEEAEEKAADIGGEHEAVLPEATKGEGIASKVQYIVHGPMSAAREGETVEVFGPKNGRYSVMALSGNGPIDQLSSGEFHKLINEGKLRKKSYNGRRSVRKHYITKSGGTTEDFNLAKKFDTEEEAKEAAAIHGGTVEPVAETKSVVKSWRGYIAKSGGYTDDVDKAEEFEPAEAEEKAEEVGGEAIPVAEPKHSAKACGQAYSMAKALHDHMTGEIDKMDHPEMAAAMKKAAKDHINSFMDTMKQLVKRHHGEDVEEIAKGFSQEVGGNSQAATGEMNMVQNGEVPEIDVMERYSTPKGYKTRKFATVMRTKSGQHFLVKKEPADPEEIKEAGALMDEMANDESVPKSYRTAIKSLRGGRVASLSPEVKKRFAKFAERFAQVTGVDVTVN